jgi:hypothetical protein
MTAQHVARESDTPAQCWCSTRRMFVNCGVFGMRMRGGLSSCEGETQSEGAEWAGGCACGGVGQ